MEELTTEYQGNTYSGHVAISGTVKLYQTIYYRGRFKEDGHSYTPYEQDTMRHFAKVILRELVKETLREEPERGG